MKNRQDKGLAVLLSKRANVFYLEYCRVQKQDDRVVYLTQTGKDVESFFNIPEKNTAFLLLGTGTSITQSAIRKLAESHVMVGFCGGGGTPHFGQVDFAFLNIESEYRPTDYMQKWAGIWFNEQQRIAVAKSFCLQRIINVEKYWKKLHGIDVDATLSDKFRQGIASAKSAQDLLLTEASWSKSLYGSLARHYAVGKFTRRSNTDERGSGSMEKINDLLDQGNYLAYGYSATALSGMGISFMFPVLHGKTRRGALVFDLADTFKDALVMPLAFEMGSARAKNQEFRDALIERLFEEKLLDFLFGLIKSTCNSFTLTEVEG